MIGVLFGDEDKYSEITLGGYNTSSIRPNSTINYEHYAPERMEPTWLINVKSFSFINGSIESTYHHYLTLIDTGSSDIWFPWTIFKRF